MLRAAQTLEAERVAKVAMREVLSVHVAKNLLPTHFLP